MSLFFVQHKHIPEACPAKDPQQGSMLLKHIERVNARKFGLEILSDAEEVLYSWCRAKAESGVSGDELFDTENTINFQINELTLKHVIEKDFEKAFSILRKVEPYFEHRHLIKNRPELRRKYRICLVLAVVAPFTVGIIFKFLLLVPMPFEGSVVELLDAIWYYDY